MEGSPHFVVLHTGYCYNLIIEVKNFNMLLLGAIAGKVSEGIGSDYYENKIKSRNQRAKLITAEGLLFLIYYEIETIFIIEILTTIIFDC